MESGAGRTGDAGVERAPAGRQIDLPEWEGCFDCRYERP